MPGMEFRLPSYPSTALPASSTATVGRIARVSDGARGLWMDQGSQWVAISGESFNVQEFGAVGDGVTNDATAIQAALNAVPSSGGEVFFSEGTYLINVLLTVRSNTLLRGVGPGSIIKQNFAHAGVSGGLIENADVVNGNSNIGFQNLTITALAVTGASPNLTGSTSGIEFQGVTDLLVQGCRFINTYIVLRPTSGTENTATVHANGKNRRVRIIGNYFEAGAEGLYFQQGTNLTVVGNVFLNAYDSTISVNSSGERIVIQGNVMDKEGNTFAALGHVELTNDVAGDTNGIRDVVVADNVMLNAANADCNGVKVQKVTKLTISGNEIRNNLGHGIFLTDGCVQVTITGNVIDVPAGGRNGILIANDGAAGHSDVLVSGTSVISASVTDSGIATGGGAQTLTDISIVGNRCKHTVANALTLGANVTNGLVAFNHFGNSIGFITGPGTGWNVYWNLTDSMGVGDGANVVFGSASGTKLGTSTAQKIGFWNATPVVQPSSYTTAAITTARIFPSTGSISTFASGAVFTSRADLEALVRVVDSIYRDLSGLGLLK